MNAYEYIYILFCMELILHSFLSWIDFIFLGSRERIMREASVGRRREVSFSVGDHAWFSREKLYLNERRIITSSICGIHWTARSSSPQGSSTHRQFLIQKWRMTRFSLIIDCFSTPLISPSHELRHQYGT